MNIRGLRAGLVVLLLAASAAASDMRTEMAVRDSLSRVHPRMRASWLRERGLDDSPYTTFRKPDSGSGPSCIGRWSYGPSYDVDGRTTPTETLVALARGSGVSLVRYSRSDSIHMTLLSDVNAAGLMCRVIVRDSLLFTGSTAGLEVWNISDETSPIRLSCTATPLNDFCLLDTLALVIGSDDQFRTYSIADLTQPRLLGTHPDSGTSIAASGNLALLGDRWGLYAVDISNPASPQRVGSWGSAIISVAARGHLAYAATSNPNQPTEITFFILDVAQPQSIQLLSQLTGVGGFSVRLADTIAYCSGDADNDFKLVSIADSLHPRVLGGSTTSGWRYGIWASGSQATAFLATWWEGLQAYSVASPSVPVRDTGAFGADLAVDIDVDGPVACVANRMSGLQILGVDDPTHPAWLSNYDSIGSYPMMRSAVVRDSFAYVGWVRPRLRVVDVSDPANPQTAGSWEAVGNPMEDMVLRDTLLYEVEAYNFRIFNVARPREPVQLGTCIIGGLNSCGLTVSDSLAYVAGTYDGLQVLNVARPSSPFLVSSNPDSRASAWGVAVRDTLVFVPSFYETLWVFSSANPESLRLLGGCSMGSGFHGYDVALSDDSLAFVATSQGIVLMDISDPAAPRRLGACATPYDARRVVYEHPYIYAACYDAGVVIAETSGLGIQEPRSSSGLSKGSYRLEPTLTQGGATITGPAGSRVEVAVYDAAGCLVIAEQRTSVPAEVDVRTINPGIYFVRVVTRTGVHVLKLTKP